MENRIKKKNLKRETVSSTSSYINIQKKKKRTEKVQTMKKKKTLQRPFFSEEVMNNFLIHLINYQDYSE